MGQNQIYTERWRGFTGIVIIRAFNRDLPYDEFVRQQLAGDGVGTGKH